MERDIILLKHTSVFSRSRKSREIQVEKWAQRLVGKGLNTWEAFFGGRIKLNCLKIFRGQLSKEEDAAVTRAYWTFNPCLTL